MTGHRRRLPWVLGLVAVLLLPAGPARAHDHPTPTERAAPAVVYVEARAQVEVSLVEHLQSDPENIHIKIDQSTWNPVLASASGFVVNPTGAIVTRGGITAVDVDRAATYAVNEAFKRRYGDQAPLTGDPFTQQRIGEPDNRLQQRLEACYPPYRSNDAGACVVRVTPTYVVYPHVSSQDEYGQLPAELLPGSTPDVAVLQVRGATSMPTVNLGESTQGAKALAVLGFRGVPNGAEPVPAVNAHLAEVGGTVHMTEDLTEKEMAAAVELVDALPAGLHGGPAIAEQGQVVGFFVSDENSGPPPAEPGRLVDAAAIREVLSAAGVTPRRGPVDTSFEAAMHAYKNGGFAAAIPDLQDTLALFEGHAMAAVSLADATAQVDAGNAGEAPPGQGDPAGRAEETGSPWLIVGAVAAAVLLLAAAAVLVLRRRRSTSAATATAPSPGPPRPREGQTAAPARPAGGPRERQAVPGHVVSGQAVPGPAVPSQAVPGPAGGRASGVVSPTESGGPGRGPAPPGRGEPAPAGPGASRLAGHGPAAAAGSASAVATGDGSPRTSRPSSVTPRGSSARLDSSLGPIPEGRPAFCTSCGTRLAPDHRFCGRCGRTAG